MTPIRHRAVTAAPDRGSFRDPSGFVFTRSGRLLRQVNRSFGARWDDLVESGVLVDLQRRRLLIAHEPGDSADAMTTEAHAVIVPQELPFISYPYEWSFGELKDAALLTLEVQGLASNAGFTLRDASAYNVQFLDGRPVLIDTLSFERATAGAPWGAYRQFCEHFLAPLALMAHRDIRLGQMLRRFVDGIPLDLAATLLPARTKLDVGLAGHVHAHASALKRAAGKAERSTPAKGMGALRQSALLDSLRRTIEHLSWHPRGTDWAEYAEHTSYDATATTAKDDLVRRFLESAGGNVVWDLGANTGRFSAIAASLGRQVIAWDGDPAATELHYRAVKEAGATQVLPLLVDLANPSPGLGFAGAERRSFVDRANADVLLALALVHHLAIGRNLPLSMITEFFASLAPQLIVEYVPGSDPMVLRMLATRVDVRPYPKVDEFRRTFETRFRLVEDQQIEGSERRLLRFVRRE
jgi:ribosomal protein L11 methylase PrmA